MKLHTIYLLESKVAQGKGRALMRAATERLYTDRFRRMVLVALSENTRSSPLYERLGGTMGGAKPFEIGGATLAEAAYGYYLAALTRAVGETG